MKIDTENHIKFCQHFCNLGYWTKEDCEKEVSAVLIGCKPCTFSIWRKSHPSRALSCFELYRNEPFEEIMHVWLDGGFEEPSKGYQLRPYNHAQTELIHNSGLIGV